MLFTTITDNFKELVASKYGVELADHVFLNDDSYIKKLERELEEQKKSSLENIRDWTSKTSYELYHLHLLEHNVRNADAIERIISKEERLGKQMEFRDIIEEYRNHFQYNSLCRDALNMTSNFFCQKVSDIVKEDVPKNFSFLLSDYNTFRDKKIEDIKNKVYKAEQDVKWYYEQYNLVISEKEKLKNFFADINTWKIEVFSLITPNETNDFDRIKYVTNVSDDNRIAKVTDSVVFAVQEIIERITGSEELDEVISVTIKNKFKFEPKLQINIGTDYYVIITKVV